MNSRMTIAFRYTAIVLLILLAVPANAADVWMSRLSGRHLVGDGPGYRNGYTSVDWFLPLLPDGGDTMWFGDFRAILSSDAEFSSNVGTGYRWFDPERNRIYGINAWWDTRQQDQFTFNQVGIGFET